MNYLKSFLTIVISYIVIALLCVGIETLLESNDKKTETPKQKTSSPITVNNDTYNEEDEWWKDGPEYYNPLKVKMYDVDSSCFYQVGYDYDNEYLILIFLNSVDDYIYVYEDFNSSEWSAFYNSESLGSYYNKYIKGKYWCERYSYDGTYDKSTNN